MPRSIIIGRMVTGIVTLLLVLLVLRVAAESESRKFIAGGVLAFGALQWVFLGKLGKMFAAEDAAIAQAASEAEQLDAADSED